MLQPTVTAATSLTAPLEEAERHRARSEMASCYPPHCRFYLTVLLITETTRSDSQVYGLSTGMLGKPSKSLVFRVTIVTVYQGGSSMNASR
jgi:hypothetical protein